MIHLAITIFGTILDNNSLVRAVLSLEKRKMLADVTFCFKELKMKINIEKNSKLKIYIEFYSEGDRYSLIISHNEICLDKCVGTQCFSTEYQILGIVFQ